jgi:aminoglycoside phosphotransferase (APT) family kinase protein
LHRYLPQFFGHDPLRQLLVLGLVPGSQSLHDYHAARGHFSVTVARALGDALGHLHGIRNLAEDDDKHPQIGRAPWVLSLHRPDLRTLQHLSSATIELVKTLQQIPDLCDHLDSLRLEWTATTLIHNDIRWDNCLVFAPPNTNRVTRLKLVDWELSGAGDPYWDIGCAFSEYLTFWVSSIPITGGTPPDRFLHLSRHPIEQMQPAMRSLWQAYMSRTGADPDASKGLLQRGVRYAAARLVQSAFERAQNSTWITSDVICLLQLSLNILQEPVGAAATLLGIPDDDGGGSE